MNLRAIEIFPCSNLPSGGWFGEDSSILGGRGELAKSSFMTVVRFVLRDNYHVWVRYLRKVLYAGWNGMF